MRLKEVRKLVDFEILSDDLSKVEPLKVREIKVLQTYVGGEKVL